MSSGNRKRRMAWVCCNVVFLCAAVFLGASASAATVTWTGSGDGYSLFQEANWDAAGGTLTGDYIPKGPATTPHDLVIDISGDVGGSGGVIDTLDLGGVGSLTVTNAADYFRMNTGGNCTLKDGTAYFKAGDGDFDFEGTWDNMDVTIGTGIDVADGVLALINGTTVDTEWCASNRMTLAGGSVLSIRGTGNVLANGRVNLLDMDSAVVFSGGKTVAAVVADHLSGDLADHGTDAAGHILVNGYGAVQGVNVSVATNPATGFTTVQAVQLLTNGSFETGDFTGWTEYGTPTVPIQVIQTAGWAASDGTNGYWMQGWSVNQDGGIWQDVSAISGNAYTLDADCKLETAFPTNGGTLEVSLQVLDDGGAVLASDSVSLTQATAFAAIPTLTAQAVTEAQSVRALVHWTTTANANDGSDSKSAFADHFVMQTYSGGLVNNSFETGDFTGWTTSGSAHWVVQQWWAASDGAWGLQMPGWGGATGSTYQDIAAAEDYTYTLSADAMLDSNFADNGGSVTISMHFLDASDTVLQSSSNVLNSANNPGGSPPDPVSPLEDRAPAGTETIRVQIDWDATVSPGGNAAVDNLVLTGQFIPQGGVFIIR
jgi:hypothetical protein